MHAIVHVVEVGIGDVTGAVLKVKRKTIASSSVWLPLGWNDKLRHGLWNEKTGGIIKTFELCGGDIYKPKMNLSADHKKATQLSVCHQEK